MLEKIPYEMGHALRKVRAGMSELIFNADSMMGVRNAIAVSSPAFNPGEELPARFTADGTGTSPPLAWRNVPSRAESIILIVEDPDAPMPEPLVHAIVWDLPGRDHELAEGDIPCKLSRGAGLRMGRNSFLKPQYLPPDPPKGHGVHHYVFQVFALDSRPSLGDPPSRRQVVAAIRDHVLARGLLIGRYERR